MRRGEGAGCFCKLLASCTGTKHVHMETVAAEGGCFCNIRTGVCSVIFQEAIHLPFAWLMVPQRTNRKLNWKFGSVGGRRRPDLPKGIVLSGSEDDARDSFLLGNSLIFFLRDNIMP